MKVFQKQGSGNTEETIELAVQYAKSHSCDLVVASSSGYSAKMAVRVMNKLGCTQRLVIVTLASSRGRNSFPASLKREFREGGTEVVTAAHALSAGERGIRTQLGGAYPLEMMAATLKMFGEGAKVCVECAVMAADADAVVYGRPVVAMGGTASGVDTAMVITPANAASILETRIHEILCKPGLL